MPSRILSSPAAFSHPALQNRHSAHTNNITTSSAATRPRNGRRVHAGAGSENSAAAPQETFLDTRSIIDEARTKSSGNFVFEYDSEEDDDSGAVYSLFEQRMAEQAETGVIDQSGADTTPPAVAADTVDLPSAYTEDFREISVEELQDSASSMSVLLDVREPHEYAASHAPGAINVPLGQLTAEAQAGRLPPKDAPIAVICQSGRRSAQAVVRLTKVLGYVEVSNVKGGILAHIAAGFPTET